jgi:hypothetical protein
MRNTHKKRNLTEKRQIWINLLEERPNGLQVLECFSWRGLATQSQIETLTGLSTKQARVVIDLFLNQYNGSPALLRSTAINLQGQRGRPQRVFLLTTEGGAVLKAMLPDTSPTVSQISSEVELAHALMEMEVHTLACIAKLRSETEKVLPFEDRRYIRADVLVEGQIIFEMEQSARPGDIPRLHEKLEQYRQFFQSEQSAGIAKDLRFLFNLAADDQRTIQHWALALKEMELQHGKLPFSLYWMPVLAFIQNPEWDSLDSFNLLEAAAEQPVAQTSAAASLALAPGSGRELLPAFLRDYRQSVDFQHLSIILQALSTQIQEEYETSAFPYVGRGAFFDLMRTIYQVSHYKDGPVMKQAALPVLSLILLYRYLNMHQNLRLLEIMRHSRDEVRKSQNRGINLYRDAYCRMCWEFLRYHGFGRNGPLQLVVYIPHLGSEDSEVSVAIKISDRDLVIGMDGVYAWGDLELSEKALAWVLSAFWIYGEELDLIVKGGKNARSQTSKVV